MNPNLLDEYSLEILTILQGGYRTDQELFGRHGCPRTSLLSLEEIGYICRPGNGDIWHITTQGLEALAAHQQATPAGVAL